jgi:hypothetical protein
MPKFASKIYAGFSVHELDIATLCPKSPKPGRIAYLVKVGILGRLSPKNEVPCGNFCWFRTTVKTTVEPPLPYRTFFRDSSLKLQLTTPSFSLNVCSARDVFWNNNAVDLQCGDSQRSVCHPTPKGLNLLQAVLPAISPLPALKIPYALCILLTLQMRQLQLQ